MWILKLEYDELTDLWHSLKGTIESREKNIGIIKMVCPAKPEKISIPMFHVYTSKEDSHAVGKMLLEFIKKDIYYEEDSIMKTLSWNEYQVQKQGT